MGLNTYTIEQVNIKDPKPWSKNGKQGQFWGVGLRINGNWYNTTIWNESGLQVFKTLKGGDKMVLELFQEESKNGKMYPKFKFPDEVEILSGRMDKMAEFIKALIKLNNLKTDEGS